MLPTERPTETLQSQPEPPSGPPPPPNQLSQKRLLLRLRYLAAGAGLAVLFVAAVIVLGEAAGWLRERAGAPDPETQTGGTDLPATPQRNDSDCEPQTVVAPETGRWRTATRRGDIQLAAQGGATRLTIRIYRAGSADDSAQLSVELLPSAEVESRIGIAPPGGAKEALLMTFSPEFQAPPRAYELERVGAVNGVVLAETDGRFVGVVGLRASSCFALRAAGWEEGASERSAELVVEVEAVD
jgi:hypothetical protein